MKALSLKPVTQGVGCGVWGVGKIIILLASGSGGRKLMGSDAHIPSTSRNSKGFSLIKETALLLGKFFPLTLHPTPYTLPTFQVACHPVRTDTPHPP